MKAVPLALAACLAACQPTRPPECPGTRVGSFAFHASLAVPATTCPFAGSLETPLDFGGTLSWDPAGGDAALCLDRPRSAPHTGSHSGDHVLVQVVFDGVELSPCSCPTQVVESVEGEVARDAQGNAIGFLGTLRNQVTPTQATLPDGSPPGDCYCGPPCEVRYALQAPAPAQPVKVR